MPNHIHGILILHNDPGYFATGRNGNYDDRIHTNVQNKNAFDDGCGDALDNVSDNVETRHAAETRYALSLSHQQNQQNYHPQTIGQKRFQNQGKNTVSSIIGSYKSAVTKHAHRLGYDFAWQPRFYDQIIRDEKSFYRIAQYIRNNPLKWQDDTYYG